MKGPVGFLDWIIEKLKRGEPVPDEPVELVVVPTFEAEVIAARLRDGEIRADVYPLAISASQSRVMVRYDDLAAARAVLADSAEGPEKEA